LLPFLLLPAWGCCCMSSWANWTGCWWASLAFALVPGRVPFPLELEVDLLRSLPPQLAEFFRLSFIVYFSLKDDSRKSGLFWWGNCYFSLWWPLKHDWPVTVKSRHLAALLLSTQQARQQ
jgi:hypothetical protein